MKGNKKVFIAGGTVMALGVAGALILLFLLAGKGQAEPSEFHSLQAVKDYYRVYWQEKLQAQGRPSGKEEVYYLDFDDSEDDDDTILKKMAKDDMELAIKVITVDAEYRFRAYRTVLTCRYLDGKIHVGQREDLEWPAIRTRQEALAEPMDFLHWFWQTDWEEMQNGERFIGDARVLARMSGDYARENDTARYLALQEPVTAAEDFLRLGGGTGEFILESLDYGMLIYTFEDGTKAHYYMRKAGEIWYPFYLDASERAEEEAQNARDIRDALENAKAETLRAVTTKACMGYENAELYVKGNFLLMEDIPEYDAALYGLGMGDGLVLRVRDAVYPVYLPWDIYYSFPDFHADDYDGDGEREYAVRIQNGRGTGYLTYALYIMDISGGAMQVREFSYDDWGLQLTRRISCRYQDGLLEIFDRGDRIFDTTDLEPYLAEREETFADLEWGSIMDFVLKDGQWYFDTLVGYCADGRATSDYEYNVHMVSPVSYKADGTFELGEIRIM